MNFTETIVNRSLPEPNSGCWIWLGAISGDGYGKFKADGRQHRAHRISYKLRYGEFNSDFMVCHKCDNALCVNPDHLFLGSAKDNSSDMVAKGRSTKGRLPVNSKINTETVLGIFNSPGTHLSIADKFDVCRATVSAIKSGVQWSGVTGKNYRKTDKLFCGNGHDWTPENIGVTKHKDRNSHHYCKICARERARFRRNMRV